MFVRDLIARLQEFPEDLPVLVETSRKYEIMVTPSVDLTSGSFDPYAQQSISSGTTGNGNRPCVRIFYDKK